MELVSSFSSQQVHLTLIWDYFFIVDMFPIIGCKHIIEYDWCTIPWIVRIKYRYMYRMMVPIQCLCTQIEFMEKDSPDQDDYFDCVTPNHGIIFFFKDVSLNNTLL